MLTSQAFNCEISQQVAFCRDDSFIKFRDCVAIIISAMAHFMHEICDAWWYLNKYLSITLRYSTAWNLLKLSTSYINYLSYLPSHTAADYAVCMV